MMTLARQSKVIGQTTRIKKPTKKTKLNRNVKLFGSCSKFEGGPRLAQNFSPSLRCPWNEQSKT
jgi:hypothetical protein